MFSHMMIGANDVQESKVFYHAILAHGGTNCENPPGEREVVFYDGTE